MDYRQLGATLQQVVARATWLVLVGLNDPKMIELFISGHRETLVVLPDKHSTAQLQEQWGKPWPAQLHFTDLVLGDTRDECDWYCFNDPRLNGTLPLERLQNTYPNLKLERVELRQQITLAGLLDQWKPAENDGGMLLIGPNAIPEALKAGLPSLQRVISLGWQAEVEGDILKEVNVCLERAWLVPSSNHELLDGWNLWQRDETLRIQASLTAELEALRADHVTLLSEHDALVGERNGLQSEQTALLAERDALAMERDDLQAQVRGLEERMVRINAELAEILRSINSANICLAASKD